MIVLSDKWDFNTVRLSVNEKSGFLKKPGFWTLTIVNRQVLSVILKAYW